MWLDIPTGNFIYKSTSAKVPWANVTFWDDFFSLFLPSSFSFFCFLRLSPPPPAPTPA